MNHAFVIKHLNLNKIPNQSTQILSVNVNEEIDQILEDHDLSKYKKRIVYRIYTVEVIFPILEPNERKSLNFSLSARSIYTS